jgi:hypothetical protein
MRISVFMKLERKKKNLDEKAHFKNGKFFFPTSKRISAKINSISTIQTLKNRNFSIKTWQQ